MDAKETDAWGIHPDIEVKINYEEELGLSEHFRDERATEVKNNGATPKPETAPAPEAAPPVEEGEPKKKEDEKAKFVDTALVRAVDALKAILVYQKR